jgi:hypothetical protein
MSRTRTGTKVGLGYGFLEPCIARSGAKHTCVLTVWFMQGVSVLVLDSSGPNAGGS